MELCHLSALEGPNAHCFSPVIQMEVNLGNYEGAQTNQFPTFITSLLELIPSLHEHHCSRGKPGGFVERLREGTLFGHVMEHVALEIQTLAGMGVIYGKTRRNRDGLYDIIFEYECKEAALAAGRIAFRLVRALLEGGECHFKEGLAQVCRARERNALGPSTAAIVAAARERGIPWFRLGEGSLIQLGYGSRQARVLATITSRTSCIGVDVATDKALTKFLLKEAGIQVPEGRIVETVEEAVEEARGLAGPVAIKPFNGNQGKGVSLNLRTRKEIRTAFRVAHGYSNQVLVERFIPGRHYRVLVVADRVVAVSERIPAHVTGDGRSTIAGLIEIANQDPARGEGHEKPLTRIRVDPVVLMVLARQKIGLEHVPRPGERIFLRENANLSTGGIAVDATGVIHPSTAELCVRAARVVGLDVAGIDIVISHVANPFTPGDGSVIEINAAPGIRMHHYPAQGQPRDAAGAIVDYLFPRGDKGRIPVVAVTGTNGKTTVTRLTGFILRQAGYVVGMTTSDGIQVDGRTVLAGDSTGPRSARLVLSDRSVDAAVLETARGGILRSGLSFDRSDVAVVTNLSEDHLGQDGVQTLEDLRHVKSLVVETVTRQGHGVFNADDPLVADMAEVCPGERAYFTTKPDNLTVRKHVSQGGKAVWLRGSSVVLSRSNVETVLCDLSDIPLVHGGRAMHHVENALAAVLACFCLGVSPAHIREGLARFGTDPAHNPGRLTTYDLNGRRVIIDYGHNVAGYEAIQKTARSLGLDPLLAVICVPGDRRNESVVNTGRVAGRGFDGVIIKEDADLRGRAPGEAARLLLEGVIQGGMAEESIRIILDEKGAVEEGVRQLLAAPVKEGRSPGLVIFYEKLAATIGALEAAAGHLGAQLAARVPLGPGRELPPEPSALLRLQSVSGGPGSGR